MYRIKRHWNIWNLASNNTTVTLFIFTFLSFPFLCFLFTPSFLRTLLKQTVEFTVTTVLTNMPTENQKMAKKSIGNLMRKRLSDITNSSQTIQQENHNNYNTLSLDNDSIQQLLKVYITLLYNTFSSFSLSHFSVVEFCYRNERI